MLALVAKWGAVFFAGCVACRGIRSLEKTPGWGFGTAGRSLVGQELGKDDESEARAYGWDVLRFAVAVYAVMTLLMLVFSEQIAVLFADDPAAVSVTVPFMMVMAVSLLGFGVDSATSGVLSGSGDTRWPLYGRLVGLYLFMVPLAYLGLVTPLGVLALYLAVTVETVVPAIITFYRFYTNKWISFSRRYRPSAAD
jgi:Na+-driven multidrug efflux pump